jgi:hypothetical protein
VFLAFVRPALTRPEQCLAERAPQMATRLELRPMDEVPKDPLKFNAPLRDIRVRLPVMPPPGGSDAGRAHG